MAEPPPSGHELQRLLVEQRAAAAVSLDFFARVAPLARRLGMGDFPAFQIFSSRFHETEDINTNLLRADGRILKQVHGTAVAQVDHQRDQDAPLVSCWPDGSGVVARQQLRVHLPRADADLAMLDDVATGLLVAADCIDVARLAKFTAIATISSDTVLGMPIGYWTRYEVTSVLANDVALRAAITAAVNLFGSAVDTCDQAIEATLSGVCQCLAGMDNSSYPVSEAGHCPTDNSCSDSGAPAPAETAVGACGTGDSGGSSPAVSSPAASPVAAAPVAGVPNSGAAPVVASGAGTALSVSGPTASAGIVGTQLAGLLGPLIGAVGQALTLAVAGVVEVVAAVQASAPAQPQPGPPGDDGAAPGPASITLGDKTVEIKAGSDGTSVSLTIREGGSAPETHVLGIRADGSLEVRGAGGADKVEPRAEGPLVAPCPEPSGVESPGGPSTTTDQTAPVPEAESGPSDIQDCPPPVAAVPEAKQSGSVPHPSGVVSRDRGARVAPQSSAPEEPPARDDGVLALAGEQ